MWNARGTTVTSATDVADDRVLTELFQSRAISLASTGEAADMCNARCFLRSIENARGNTKT